MNIVDRDRDSRGRIDSTPTPEDLAHLIDDLDRIHTSLDLLFDRTGGRGINPALFGRVRSAAETLSQAVESLERQRGRDPVPVS